MTVRTAPPFRADHVGSLLRPPELLRAREDRTQGRISAADLRRVEDQAIRKIVKMQEGVGLRSATDGEFRRASWHMDFIYQIGGIEKAAGNIAVRFRNEQGVIEFTPAALHVAEKLRLDRTIFGEDFAFLKSVTTNTPKLTIPSPSMVHYRGGRAAIDEKIYPDLDSFYRDLAASNGRKIADRPKFGCTYVYCTDRTLPHLNDQSHQKKIPSQGGESWHKNEITTEQITGAS